MDGLSPTQDLQERGEGRLAPLLLVPVLCLLPAQDRLLLPDHREPCGPDILQDLLWGSRRANPLVIGQILTRSRW